MPLLTLNCLVTDRHFGSKAVLARFSDDRRINAGRADEYSWRRMAHYLTDTELLSPFKSFEPQNFIWEMIIWRHAVI